MLIADDHALLRAGMHTMLASEPDLEIVGEAENGREVVELCRELRPDLVLMDVGMPEMGGLEATRLVKAECPTTCVLIVSAHPDPEYLLYAVKAGAAGYVLKAAPPEQVVGSIRRVLRGKLPLDGELAMKVIRRLASEERPRKPPAPDGNPGPEVPLSLTTRELGILTLLCRGRTNRQIAADLHLSLSTVKRHLERVMKKLGVSDHTQAAVRAVELGLIEPETMKQDPSFPKRATRPTGMSHLTDVRRPPCRHTGWCREVARVLWPTGQGSHLVRGVRRGGSLADGAGSSLLSRERSRTDEGEAGEDARPVEDDGPGGCSGRGAGGRPGGACGKR